MKDETTRPYDFPLSTRFSATRSYPASVLERAADLIENLPAARQVILYLTRLEELRLLAAGQLVVACAGATSDLDENTASQVIDAIEDYAYQRVDRATDDILRFRKP